MGLIVDKSDVQELLAALYLRLNGYFPSGFIVHAPSGNLTEIDLLAVRFPHHEEPEREVDPCQHLHPPKGCIDFLIGEVKGGKRNPKFNAKFYGHPEGVKKVLKRIGAFTSDDITQLLPAIIDAAKPSRWRTYTDFPSLSVPLSHGQVRLILFAPDQSRGQGGGRPTIYGDDMVNFIWRCLCPTETRVGCAVKYNYELWGSQFIALVSHFKKNCRDAPGTINDIYLSLLGSTDDAVDQTPGSVSGTAGCAVNGTGFGVC